MRGPALILLLPALAGFAVSAGATPRARHVVERAVIRAHSGRMPDSGILSTLVSLTVDVGGGLYRMYVQNMHYDQFIPPVNSVCRIAFRYDYALSQGITSEESVEPGQLRMFVDQLECDTGRLP
jgi:hypothetical protein